MSCTKSKIMGKVYWILNKKTGQTYDDIEGKFFDSNWEPEYIDDKEHLQILMHDDPEKFKDCIIEEKDLRPE